MRLLWLALILLGLPFQVYAGRILALSPVACEMVSALGAVDEIVGISEYCDFPPKLKGLPFVSNHAQVFVESAMRLHPDVVIASSPVLKGLEKLKGVGVRVFVTHPRSLDEISNDLVRLGLFLGRPEKGRKASQAMRQALDVIRARVTQRQRVFFEVWSDPLMTEGGKSYITEVLKVAGGDNVFASVDRETLKVSIEAVIRAAPDFIIIPGSGDDNRKAFWQRWLPKARIIRIDADLISRPGPRIVQGIRHLQQALGYRHE